MRIDVLMISVTGEVRLSPADPLDEEITAAFNDHQRRTVDGRTLLGPDAVEATLAAFARHRCAVSAAAADPAHAARDGTDAEHRRLRPARGVAAWASGAAGLTAAQGWPPPQYTATLVLVASLPGAVGLLGRGTRPAADGREAAVRG